MSEFNQPPQDAATRAKLQQVQRNFGAAAADYVTSKVHATGQDLSWLVEAAALTWDGTRTGYRHWWWSCCVRSGSPCR